MNKLVVLALCALITGCQNFRPETTVTRNSVDEEGNPVTETRTYAGAKSLSIGTRSDTQNRLVDALGKAEEMAASFNLEKARIELAKEQAKVLTAEQLSVMSPAAQMAYVITRGFVQHAEIIKGDVTPDLRSGLADYGIAIEQANLEKDKARYVMWDRITTNLAGVVKFGVGAIALSKAAETIAENAGNKVSINDSTINGGTTTPGQIPCVDGVDCTAAGASSSSTGDVVISAGDNPINVTRPSGNVDADTASGQSITAPSTGDSTATGDGASSATTSPAATTQQGDDAPLFEFAREQEQQELSPQTAVDLLQ